MELSSQIMYVGGYNICGKYALKFALYYIQYIGPRHEIPARGRPISKMTENNQTVAVPPQLIKEPVEVLKDYENIRGSITVFSPFGNNRPNLISRRDKVFYEHYPTFDPIFHTIVNGDFTLFSGGLLLLVAMTSTLA